MGKIPDIKEVETPYVVQVPVASYPLDFRPTSVTIGRPWTTEPVAVAVYPPNYQTRQPQPEPMAPSYPQNLHCPSEPMATNPPNSQPRQPNSPVGSPWVEAVAPQPVGLPWSTGLFDCHQNQTNAVITALLPCMTFGQIAEVLDEGKTSCGIASFKFVARMYSGTHWILGKNYRKKLREKFGLVEAPYHDWLSHIFCPLCSLCQEFRELQFHGLDPALGWNGILARRQEMQYGNHDGQIGTPPPAQQMSR